MRLDTVKRVRYHGILHTYHVPKVSESIEMCFKLSTDVIWLVGKIMDVYKCSDGSGDIIRIHFLATSRTKEMTEEVRLDTRDFPKLWHFSHAGNLY